MKIKLTEIPNSGHDYSFDETSKELKAVLSDLLHTTSYSTKINITPLEKGYMLKGTFHGHIPEMCSACGDPLQLPIYKSFQEFLLPKEEEPRNSSYSHSGRNQSDVQEDWEAFFYEDDIFDFGEYIHELIALNTPYQPKAPANEKGNCSQCLKPFDWKMSELSKNEDDISNPFGVLKNLTLKNQNKSNS